MRLDLATILSSPWLIDPEQMGGYELLLFQLMQGTHKVDEVAAAKARSLNVAFAASAFEVMARSGSTLSDAKPNSIAVIPIKGEIVKYDAFCGPRGTESIIADIRAIKANPNIAGVIFDIDTPGGMVTNTDRLSAEIKSLNIPKLTWVNGYCTSAGEWIGSSADEFYCSSPIDRVGSIGTMLYFMDVRPALEKMGVKFHELYATLSTGKNADFREILESKYDNYRTNTLDPLNKMFHDAIRTNRPKVSEKVFDGHSMFASDAIPLGLVDGIMSWEEVVERMQEIIRQKSNSNMETAKKNGAKYKHTSAFFGFTEGFEMTAEGFHINEEMLDTLEAKLGAESDDKETIAKLTKANEKAAEHSKTLEAKIEQLEKKPAAPPTKVDKQKDNIGNPDADDEPLSAIEIEAKERGKIRAFNFKDSD